MLNSGQWVTRPRRRRTNGRDHIVCTWCPVGTREKTPCDNEIPAKWCPVCPAACFFSIKSTTLTVTQRTTLWRLQTKDTWNFCVSNGVELAYDDDDELLLIRFDKMFDFPGSSRKVSQISPTKNTRDLKWWRCLNIDVRPTLQQLDYTLQTVCVCVYSSA